MTFKSSLPSFLFFLFLSTSAIANRHEQQTDNPYVLDQESFELGVQNRNGFARRSKRFSLISNLLRGIDNYRLSIFELNPRTFAIPHHFDAEHVFFVIQGKGTMHVVQQEKKESYNLERGDVLRIPAGSTHYLINTDNNDKFRIASLFQSISTPGEFFAFFGASGQKPESFYNSFSDDILEAAFNSSLDKMDRVFRQNNKGSFVEASGEQIGALRRNESGSGWFGHGSHSSRVPYNLLNKRPTQANQYGQLFEVFANEYKQLRDLDVAVTFHNITKGAMVAPFYNSRATSLAIVTEGTGHFEMVCPHLSSHQSQSQKEGREQGEEGESGETHYQRVSAWLSPRTAVIVPAGHLVSMVASDDQHLQFVAFKVNAENNEKYFLAGRSNVLNQLGKEAKELSFNMPARDVEAILNNQRHSGFLPGPNQRQQKRAGTP